MSNDKTPSGGERSFTFYRNETAKYVQETNKPNYCVPAEWHAQEAHVHEIWESLSENFTRTLGERLEMVGDTSSINIMGYLVSVTNSPDDTGLYFATSSELKGLVVAKADRQELIEYLPTAVSNLLKETKIFDPEAAFIADGLAEVERARKLWPGNKQRLAILLEELGEVAKSLLDYDSGVAKNDDVYTELVQCLAMVIRLACEGDASFKWRSEHEDNKG
jgi:hypothetical protein